MGREGAAKESKGCCGDAVEAEEREEVGGKTVDCDAAAKVLLGVYYVFF